MFIIKCPRVNTETIRSRIEPPSFSSWSTPLPPSIPYTFLPPAAMTLIHLHSAVYVTCLRLDGQPASQPAQQTDTLM